MFGKVDDMQRDGEALGEAAHPFLLLCSAAMRQAHEKTFDVVPVGKEQGAGGGVDAAAHRYADG